MARRGRAKRGRGKSSTRDTEEASHNAGRRHENENVQRNKRGNGSVHGTKRKGVYETEPRLRKRVFEGVWRGKKKYGSRVCRTEIEESEKGMVTEEGTPCGRTVRNEDHLTKLCGHRAVGGRNATEGGPNGARCSDNTMA